MLRGSRTSFKVIAAALVAAMAVVPVTSTDAQGRRARVREVVPGLTYTRIVDPKGPWRIRILSVDLSQGLTLDLALANDKLPYHEKTSSMARRYGAVAATNGDFGLPSGRPMNTFAMDGELVQTETGRTWSTNFAVSTDETTFYMRHSPKPLVWAVEHDVAMQHSLARLNQGAPAVDELAQFTPRGGALEKPPRDSCSARLYPLAPVAFADDFYGVQTRYSVDQVKCQSRRLARFGGAVVSAPLAGTRAPAITSWIPGEEITLGWVMPNWYKVLDTVGGNPWLVRKGVVNVPRTCWKCGPDNIMKRHPRTAVAFDAESHLIFLVTVDGRQPGYSRGMTPYRFAQELVALGVDEALNLDGGGSTTMVVNGRVVNRPSDDDGERPVSSAILVLQGDDPGETGIAQTYAAEPTAEPSPTASPGPTASPAPAPAPASATSVRESPAEVWADVARDGGSTAGLAQYLHRLGYRLPPALRRVVAHRRGT